MVEEVGAEVTTLAPGDFVIAPFAVSGGDVRVLPRGAADLLRQRRLLDTPARHGGGQAEAVRVPLADGTLVEVPVGEDTERCCRPC